MSFVIYLLQEDLLAESDAVVLALVLAFDCVVNVVLYLLLACSLCVHLLLLVRLPVSQLVVQLVVYALL